MAFTCDNLCNASVLQLVIRCNPQMKSEVDHVLIQYRTVVIRVQIVRPY